MGKGAFRGAKHGAKIWAIKGNFPLGLNSAFWTLKHYSGLFLKFTWLGRFFVVFLFFLQTHLSPMEPMYDIFINMYLCFIENSMIWQGDILAEKEQTKNRSSTSRNMQQIMSVFRLWSFSLSLCYAIADISSGENCPDPPRCDLYHPQPKQLQCLAMSIFAPPEEKFCPFFKTNSLAGENRGSFIMEKCKSTQSLKS